MTEHVCHDPPRMYTRDLVRSCTHRVLHCRCWVFCSDSEGARLLLPVCPYDITKLCRMHAPLLSGWQQQPACWHSRPPRMQHVCSRCWYPSGVGLVLCWTLRRWRAAALPFMPAALAFRSSIQVTTYVDNIKHRSNCHLCACWLILDIVMEMVANATIAAT